MIDDGYIEKGLYYYYLTDHLGNNRVVADAKGNIVQKTHYEPFGKAFEEEDDEVKEKEGQPYLYNGKELYSEHGLDLYDYSARLYNLNKDGFDTMDPLAEKFYLWSPYVYCYNNPMKFADPDGNHPAVAGLIVARFAIGAGIDAAAQVGINMIVKGNDFYTAVDNIDITGVVAGGIIGAITIPGVSTAIRMGVTGSAMTGNAMVDYTTAEGVKSVVDGTKSIEQATTELGIDAITMGLGHGTTKAVSSTMQSAVKSDVAAIVKQGSGIGNKNVINNATRDAAIKEVQATAQYMERIINVGIETSTTTTNKAVVEIRDRK